MKNLLSKILLKMQEKETRTEEQIEADRYAYLKKQYDLATYMEENREGDPIQISCCKIK